MQDRPHDEGIRPELPADRYQEKRPSEKNRLEVDFTLQIEDALAFQDYHMSHQGKETRSSLWWAIPAFSLLIGALALFTILADPQRVDTRSILAVVVATLVLGSYALRRPFLRAATRRNLRGDRLFFMTHRVVLTPEAVEYSVGPSVSRTLWEGIVNVVATGTHLFLYTAKAQAIVVPVRAFDSEDDFEDLIDAAQQYYRRARRGRSEE